MNKLVPHLYLSIIAVTVLLFGFGLFFMYNQPPSQPLLGEVHKHADFKVYLNGERYNFSQQVYISSQNKTLSNFVHLHDMDGEVIHQHIAGVTLGEFFNSLKIKFNSTCFVLDNNEFFCNNGDSNVKLFVNGVVNSAFERYEFDDLDRILISYGDDNETDIAEQLNSVSDKACISSLKCPERGVATDESTCLTGEDCIA